MKMLAILDVVNFNIKRFQNIRVEIYNDFYTRDVDEKEPLKNVNTRLSGYWYVTGINYTFNKRGGAEQEITLMRRDLNKNYEKAFVEEFIVK